MKTSQQQFELLITYVEQHGDLSKPFTNARGRMAAIRNWEILTDMLNSDGSGDSETTEKWKKVWSDLKNNTKKKAARLHRAAIGTGGGPAVYSKLSNLEERVLNLIGVQAAAGLALEEAGFSQDVHIELESRAESNVAPGSSIIKSSQLGEDIDLWNQPGPSSRALIAPPSHLTSPLDVQEINEGIRGGDDTNQCTPFQSHVAVPISEVQPALSGNTLNQDSPRRSVRVSPQRLDAGSPYPNIRSPRRFARRSPRRSTRLLRTEEASQHFLHSDREWREFRMQQHRDEMEMKREQIKLREMEIQTQQQWQAVALRCLDIVDKFFDKQHRDGST